MSATRFLARLSLSFVILGAGQLASAADAGAASPRDVVGTWAT